MNSADIVRRRKSELTKELQEITEKLSSLAKALQLVPESQKTSVKKRIVVYQRRKITIEQRLMKLETYEFNTELLTLDCEQHEPKPISHCIVVGHEAEYKSEELVPKINCLIEIMAGNSAPSFDEEEFREEINELEGRTTPVSLDNLVAEF